ncbi:MAG: polysaccharide ABC transporter ATP-binding protein [bacterium]
MSVAAIVAEALSKRYRIGPLRRYKTLRDTLAEAIVAPFRWIPAMLRPLASGDGENSTVWALKDVSFEIKQGEVVGLIGRNGAGKSTLLRILSRITEPTSGYAEIRGRVGSLLEVGIGFHPELTGRENTYLNSAILGMRKREIDRKFDEIVAFAEIERFVDTPVKFYSSGMHIRLAFAVAAHLEPEILLVDEVLAVGDSAFQKKCLGKMQDVAEGGRTVLFVSHQLNQIRRLCSDCVWLDGGQMRQFGPTAEVVSAYEASAARGEGAGNEQRTARARTRFVSWEIVEPRDGLPNNLGTLGPFTFRLLVDVARPIRNGHHGIALRGYDEQLMWAWAAANVRLDVGMHELIYTLPTLPLRPGTYHWQVSLRDDGALLDDWHCVPGLIISTEPHTHPRDEWTGLLNLPCNFEARPLQVRAK